MVIETNYGGDEKWLEFHQNGSVAYNAYKSNSSAYLLVYVRTEDIPEIFMDIQD